MLWKHKTIFIGILENIPGVTKVISLSSVAKRALSGYAEGNLKWTYLPRNERALCIRNKCS